MDDAAVLPARHRLTVDDYHWMADAGIFGKDDRIERAYLRSLPANVTMEHLERITGRDRWSLSRDFRSLFGTSPYRCLVLRRLDAAKMLIRPGRPLSEATLETGFSDQSHMTRQFSKAFGIPQSRWLRLQAG